MGNRRLWAAMEERDVIYSQAEITTEDGMKLGELEGIVGEEDGYTAETDAALLLQGLDIPDEFTSARWAKCKVDRRFGCCSHRPFSDIPRLCCSMNRRTTSISIRSTGFS